MLENAFSGTPLKYLELVFIVLFSFIAIYILTVILAMSLRLRRFLITRKDNKITENISQNKPNKEEKKSSDKKTFKSSKEKFIRNIKKFSIIFYIDYIKKPILYLKNLFIVFATTVKKIFKLLVSVTKVYYNKIYKFIRAKILIISSIISKRIKCLIKSLKDFIDNKRNLD